MIIRNDTGPQEEIIDPEIEITDAHHHFFPPGKYEFEGLEDYTLDQLLADTGAGHRVTNSVYVEANAGLVWSGLEEVAAVTEFARESEQRGGSVVRKIVGDADLKEGSAAGETLDRMREVSGGRFVGIRQASVFDPSPDIWTYPTNPGEKLLLRSDFQAGFAELASRDMTFDAWLYHPQLLDVAALADSFPETRIIVDHLGGPVKLGPYGANRDETLAVWRRHMTELAKRPNIFVKLGGFGLGDFVERADVTGDPDVEPTSAQLAEFWGPEVRWLIETFGVDRCMFESNFPIDNPMCSYVVLWNALKRMVSDASPDEKRALFAGTANRVYGITA